MPASFDLTGLILTGGESRRMGRPKADILIGGRSMVGWVIQALTPYCRELILVDRNPLDHLDLGARVVRDLVPGQGPLGGLATGLFYSRWPHALVVACDLPLIQGPILELLARKALAAGTGPRVIVPRTPGGWQPLVAVYSKACLKPALDLLAQGERKADEIRRQHVAWDPVSETELRAVDPELESFFNVNRPEDLAVAQARLAHRMAGGAGRPLPPIPAS
jgi:molybdopterin-guanine dinucleotide biosynthesis protein A